MLFKTPFLTLGKMQLLILPDRWSWVQDWPFDSSELCDLKATSVVLAWFPYNIKKAEKNSASPHRSIVRIEWDDCS